MSKYVFVIPTLSNGGAERVVSVLSSALYRQGEEVSIIKYHDMPNEYSVSNGVKIFNLSDGNADDYKKLSYFEKVKKIREILKKESPDFVIPFMFSVAFTTWIAKLGLKPMLFQSIRINPAIGPSSKVFRIIRDLLVYSSKCTFVQNQDQKNYFSKLFQSKIHILFNPVDDELFESSPSCNNEKYTIISVGRLDEQKNFKLLIDAFNYSFKTNKNVQLLIYGSGSLAEELNDYIKAKELQESVKLMGRSSNIKSVYENADLFVLSSDFEGMPNALIEAMAVGLPCVSTDCPTGPGDLITNMENGLLVPMRNIEALGNAMKWCFENVEQSRYMASLGKETVREKCDSNSIAKQMISICKSV